MSALSTVKTPLAAPAQIRWWEFPKWVFGPCTPQVCLGLLHDEKHCVDKLQYFCPQSANYSFRGRVGRWAAGVKGPKALLPCDLLKQGIAQPPLKGAKKSDEE